MPPAPITSDDDPRAKGRRFLFVLNNPTAEETPESVLAWPVKFITFQLERGERCGTLHYQGYLESEGQVRISSLKKLNSRAHFRLARGNVEENRAYASKEKTRVDGPWERGTPSGGQGQRSDLLVVADQVKQMVPLRLIAESHPTSYIKYHRGILALRQRIQKPRQHTTEGVYIWGPPGTGKTTWAIAAHPGAYWKTSDMWWQDYDGEETVIFDEWLCAHHKLTEMNQLVSHNPHKVQSKGGSVEFVAKKVIIISNIPLYDAYPNCPQMAREAFLGRFKVYHKLTKDGEPILTDNPFYTRRMAA